MNIHDLLIQEWQRRSTNPSDQAQWVMNQNWSTQIATYDHYYQSKRDSHPDYHTQKITYPLTASLIFAQTHGNYEWARQILYHPSILRKIDDSHYRFIPFPNGDSREEYTFNNGFNVFAQFALNSSSLSSLQFLSQELPRLQSLNAIPHNTPLDSKFGIFRPHDSFYQLSFSDRFLFLQEFQKIQFEHFNPISLKPPTLENPEAPQSKSDLKALRDHAHDCQYWASRHDLQIFQSCLYDSLRIAYRTDSLSRDPSAALYRFSSFGDSSRDEWTLTCLEHYDQKIKQLSASKLPSRRKKLLIQEEATLSSLLIVSSFLHTQPQSFEFIVSHPKLFSLPSFSVTSLSEISKSQAQSPFLYLSSSIQSFLESFRLTTSHSNRYGESVGPRNLCPTLDRFIMLFDFLDRHASPIPWFETPESESLLWIHRLHLTHAFDYPSFASHFIRASQECEQRLSSPQFQKLILESYFMFESTTGSNRIYSDLASLSHNLEAQMEYSTQLFEHLKKSLQNLELQSHLSIDSISPFLKTILLNYYQFTQNNPDCELPSLLGLIDRNLKPSPLLSSLHHYLFMHSLSPKDITPPGSQLRL